MCCIGACYSNRVVLSDVREMMDALWTAMERDCRILSEESLHDADVAEVTTSTIEELQAVLLTSILHVGNGTSQQRHRALRISPMIAAQARRLGLLGVSGDPSVYSPLHHPKAGGYDIKIDDFDWIAWVGQELRVRLMHALLVHDTALELFFNISAQFDPSEVHLPLPCDDAAWNCASTDDCASALGLNGEALARTVNPYGTRRAAQPDMHIARQVLLDDSWRIKPGSTNILGKSLLGINLISIIRLSQKVGSLNYLHTGDGLPSLDWIIPCEGPTQPTEVSAADSLLSLEPRTLSMLISALNKLQANWREDLPMQVPSQEKSTQISGKGTLLPLIARHILLNPGFANLEARGEDSYVATSRALSLVYNSLSTNKSDTEKSDEIQEAKVQFGETEYILDLARIFGPVPHESDNSGSA